LYNTVPHKHSAKQNFCYNDPMKKNYYNVKKIIRELTKQNQTVTFAESCTGGRIASAFTAVSGSSSVLRGSCVAYANSIKESWLGVPHQVLENHGAVSKECVEYMLQGMQKMANSDYTLAVSGIAGPTGGSRLKPVGTVYIGILTPSFMHVEKCFFTGDREQIQKLATQFAISLLEKNIK